MPRETKVYYRPLAQTGGRSPSGAVQIAGGATWFTHAERITRSGDAEFVLAEAIPEHVLGRLRAPREAIAGLAMDRPNIMGILNVTPDSFSDGGAFSEMSHAVMHATDMISAGADIIDVGGESTRPGAVLVPAEEEIARVVPSIEAIREASDAPISIDTRKEPVARAAVQAGASLVNDVSGLAFDSRMAQFCSEARVPICIMHSQGDPETMQDEPCYDNVLLDVYDALEERIEALEAHGVPRSMMIVDPGIGFGKTQSHNLALLKGLSLFHGLGCAILLGVSRKRFIGAIGDAEQAADRAPGSIAVGLAGVAQGVQILRVHDVPETAQALKLWRAVTEGN